MRLSYTQCANNLLINYSFILLNKPITHFTVAEPVALSLQMVCGLGTFAVLTQAVMMSFLFVFFSVSCAGRGTRPKTCPSRTLMWMSLGTSPFRKRRLCTAPPLLSLRGK